ncbi:MAG TPA: isocitrate/isopropylmalate family dehydrogenase, partial [Candidatus Acidoferrales bacterium]|nr:isocitrate/isopropylmalate family dehydrogenase [Candidatus Acidoferrales bacterium]
MTHRIAVVPGDGAGREVVPEAVKVLRASGAQLVFEEFEVGAERVLRGDPAMPESVFQELQKADAILFGAIGDPRVSEPYAAGVLLRVRFELDLYANVRPAKLYDER